MFSRQRLFWLSKLYDLPASDAPFLRALRDMTAWHMKRCPEYRAVAQAQGFSPEQVQTAEDLSRVPVLPTLFFKRHAVFSMPKWWPMAMRVTSSGTSGSFSRVNFDWGCVFAEIPMVLRIGFKHGLVSPIPTNCVVLGYKPNRANTTGVTRTMYGMTYFSPPIRRTYALQYADGAYKVDLDRVIADLKRYADSPFPTRIIGFPSYLWFGLKRMEELGVELKLKPGSKILLGGGWKQHYSQEVEKSRLYDLVYKVLGIPEEDIHESFGAVEHPIFYNTCPKHHFHIPAYARIIIRDVETLEPLPMGRVGLVNLITPLIKATPVTSVMTDDLGYLTPGDQCGCGIHSPYLTILGRVGLNDITTCAAGAADILGKGEGL